MRRGFLKQLSLYKKAIALFKDHFITTTGGMGSPEQQSPNSTSDINSTKIKEIGPITQVMVTSKAFSSQRLIQVMQAVATRSCSRACQLFCLPGSEKNKCFSDQTRRLREEDHAQDQHRSPPSTVLIVNISNSTSVNCVIGDSHPTVRQPSMQESHLQKADLSCSCCHSRQAAASAALAEAPHPHAQHSNINIHGSCLNSVIVGDNNCMHVPDGEPFD